MLEHKPVKKKVCACIREWGSIPEKPQPASTSPWKAKGKAMQRSEQTVYGRPASRHAGNTGRQATFAI